MPDKTTVETVPPGIAKMVATLNTIFDDTLTVQECDDRHLALASKKYGDTIERPISGPLDNEGVVMRLAMDTFKLRYRSVAEAQKGD